MAGKIYHFDHYTPARVSGRAFKWDGRAVGKLDEQNQGWLRPLNLRLGGVREVGLVKEIRNLQGAGRGSVQEKLAEDLLLTGAVSALAPTVHGQLGRGLARESDRNNKLIRKRAIDRAAAAIQGMAFDDIVRRHPELALSIDASEGGRVKPGEAGANPATYLGQLFSHPDLREMTAAELRSKKKGDVLGVVIDCVDKTGATAEGGHSAVTSFVVTSSLAKAIPDFRFVKLISGVGFGQYKIESVDADPDLVIKALAQTAGVPIDQLNAFQLVRPDRLDEIMEIYRGKGAHFYRDKDGDVMPIIASGLRMYPLDNGRPLHFYIGAGGAAEGGMMVVVDWLGGKTLLRFASSSQFKSWGTRYRLLEEEREDALLAGFDPDRTLTMYDIYENPFADGLGIFGGISDSHCIPNLMGAEVGENMAEASVLGITPQGFARIMTFDFDFVDGSRNTTVGRMTPLISQLHELDTVADMERAIQSWLSGTTRKSRLEREWRQDFYLCIDKHGKTYVLDGKTFASLMGGKEPRFNERDKAILSVLAKKTGWLSGEVPNVSAHMSFIDLASWGRTEAGNLAVLQGQEAWYDDAR